MILKKLIENFEEIESKFVETLEKLHENLKKNVVENFENVYEKWLVCDLRQF